MITIKDMYKIGSSSPISYNHKKYDPSPNDCLTFSYTSGTTGPPKGAMISHENFTSLLIAAKMSEAEFFQTDRSLSYLPLPHIMERAVVYLLITSGAEVISYSGDITKIKDDLALV
jgi:long-chain acyl-CoA synthetase